MHNGLSLDDLLVKHIDFPVFVLLNYQRVCGILYSIDGIVLASGHPLGRLLTLMCDGHLPALC